MRKTIVLTALTIGVFGAWVAEAATVTLEHGSNGVTVKDGYVRKGDKVGNYYQDNNYGGAYELAAGGQKSTARFGMVEFNNIFGSGTGLVPLNQTVQTATLRLYARTVASEQTGSLVQDLFRVHPLSVDVTNYYGEKNGTQATTGEMSSHYKSWDTLGWGSAGTSYECPVYGEDFRYDDYAEAYIHVNDDNKWIEFDVTVLVAAWQKFQNGTGGYENFGFYIRNADDWWVRAYFDTTNLTSGTDPQLVVTYVPEPMTITLLGLAGLSLLRKRGN